MRIQSADCRFDFPYKDTGLFIAPVRDRQPDYSLENPDSYGIFGLYNEGRFLMAEYSIEERAIEQIKKITRTYHTILDVTRKARGYLRFDTEEYLNTCKLGYRIQLLKES